MKILALDTSQLRATVALISDGVLVRASTGSTSVSHSESIMAIIDEVLGEGGVDGVDAFAVGIGPGSFTGIRIGCATIKALAQAAGKPVIVFSSLRATALSTNAPSKQTVALVSAYQGLVFAGYAQNDEWVEDAITVKDWLAKNIVEKPMFCGTGVKPHETLLGHAKGSLSVVEYVNEEGILRAVNESLKDKKSVKKYHEVEAHYLRASQAEINFPTRAASHRK